MEDKLRTPTPSNPSSFLHSFFLEMVVTLYTMRVIHGPGEAYHFMSCVSFWPCFIYVSVLYFVCVLNFSGSRKSRQTGFPRISKILSDWIVPDLENLVRLDCHGSWKCRSNRMSRFSKISPDWIVLVLDNLVGLGCPGSRKSRPTGLSRFSTLPSNIRYFEFVFRQ
jgi:hypothetical protein